MDDDERLRELEIRYTLQQDLLLQLSDVIARHEKEIGRLCGEVDQLRQRRGEEGDGWPPADPDEKPPHY